MTSTDQTAYIVYDVESVVDGALLSRVRYPGEELSPGQAIEKYSAERLEKTGSDFIPVTFHVPVSIAVARLDERFRLLDLLALDEPGHDPREMVALFWKGVEVYRKAVLVDFNGRGFDLPLLTLSAFRFGISCPAYFRDPDRFGHRYRFTSKHVDLQEWLTEYGAYRIVGGLNLCAKMLGKPGKMDVSGDRVAELHAEGKIGEINDYCLNDVLDTYFIFLRTRVLTGELTLEEEQETVCQTRAWLAERAESRASLGVYLENFGEWSPVPFV